MNKVMQHLCNVGIRVTDTYLMWREGLVDMLKDYRPTPANLDVWNTYRSELYSVVFQTLMCAQNYIWDESGEIVLAHEFDLTQSSEFNRSLFSYWSYVIGRNGRLSLMADDVWNAVNLTVDILNLLCVVNQVTLYKPYKLLTSEMLLAAATTFHKPEDKPDEGMSELTRVLMGDFNLREALLHNKVIDRFRYVRDTEEVNGTLIVYLTTDKDKQLSQRSTIPMVLRAPLFGMIVYEESGVIRNAGNYRQPEQTTDVEKYEREGRNGVLDQLPPFDITLSHPSLFNYLDGRLDTKPYADTGPELATSEKIEFTPLANKEH